MSDVVITVRGEQQRRVPPERATIRVVVRADGPDRSTSVDRAMALAEPVRATLRTRAEASDVAEWSSTQLSVRAERPWNDAGKQLAPVFHAHIDFSATFLSASELSVWVSEISGWDGVEIGWVNWDLTPETRATQERDVAASAVAVAVTRAEAYAAALGLTTVEAREIADLGLMASSPNPAPEARMMKASRAVAFADAGAPEMSYEPEDVTISAAVEARFVAR